MVKKEPLISVVVPVYNVEKYLNRCIESLISQSYKSLQIILVDDGSTDSSSKICDKYQKLDKRIIVIHKKNGGLSDARNAGIAKSKGEYICFVDSDDYVEKTFVEDLYKAISKNNTLLAQCDISAVDNDGKILEVFEDKTDLSVRPGIDLLKAYYDNGINNIQYLVAWNRMYHRSLLNKDSFAKGVLFEDGYFTYKILYNREVALVHKRLCNYVNNPKSISREKPTRKHWECFKESNNEKLSFFIKNSEKELANLILNHNLVNTFWYYQKFDGNRDIIFDVVNNIRYCLNTSKKNNIKIKTSLRIKSFLILYFPIFYKILSKK